MKSNTKKYTIELRDDDGKITMHRTNDGFGAFELLGMLEITKHDILDQLEGVSRGEVDVVKRTVIEE